jgi:hypothetical protein
MVDEMARVPRETKTNVPVPEHCSIHQAFQELWFRLNLLVFGRLLAVSSASRAIAKFNRRGFVISPNVVPLTIHGCRM